MQSIPYQGKSSSGRPIPVHTHGSGRLCVLLIAGVHGDESEGFLFLEKFLTEIDHGSVRVPSGVSLICVPRLNPDGCVKLRRTNEHNVDLNRNLPTRDWTGEFENVRYYPGPSAGSEEESRFTVALMEHLDPHLILSLHSYEKPMINFNGECDDLAEAMSKLNGLPAKGDIGYPTPGSLGTYAGWERNLPTITLEILRGQSPENVWETHLSGVLAALGFYLDNNLPQRKQIQ